MSPKDFSRQNTEVVSHSFLQGIFPTQDWTQVSYFAGRFLTIWATSKARTTLWKVDGYITGWMSRFLFWSPVFGTLLGKLLMYKSVSENSLSLTCRYRSFTTKICFYYFLRRPWKFITVLSVIYILVSLFMSSKIKAIMKVTFWGNLIAVYPSNNWHITIKHKIKRIKPLG